jgi:MFS family permease
VSGSVDDAATPTGVSADVERPGPAPVGRAFVARYLLAYLSTTLLLLAPLLVTLALKVGSLVGSEQAPRSLALVTGVGALVAMVGNPLFGRLSDRTSSRRGMRRPWMLAGLGGGTTGILVVALAPDIPTVLVGWCLAQLMFNALLAAMVAVLPDQVPAAQRGRISGLLGISLPVAGVVGTFLVQLVAGDQLAMFLLPCAVGAVFILLFALTLDDRRLRAPAAPWTWRELARTFYVAPRTSPDFAWAFASRFLFVLAYAFLVTYQAYYLVEQLGTPQGEVAHQVFVATSVQSAALVVASLLAGRLSDRTGRRKVFVASAAAAYGLALLVVAGAADVEVFLVGMALSGVGFGVYMAVDLALVADVLPDRQTLAKDMGVLNIAGALPFAVAPALAPLILERSGGSYAALYTVAAGCAIGGALAILPVRGVR